MDSSNMNLCSQTYTQKSQFPRLPKQSQVAPIYFFCTNQVCTRIACDTLIKQINQPVRERGEIEQPIPHKQGDNGVIETPLGLGSERVILGWGRGGWMDKVNTEVNCKT